MNAFSKSLFLSTVGLMLLTTIGSCGPGVYDARPSQTQRSPAAVLRGRLFDGASGKPVDGAIVEWSMSDRKQAGSTDSKGVFSFSIPVRDEAGEVVLSTIANLYRSERRHVEIHPGRTIKVEFGLRTRPEKEIGVVRGTLKDADTGRGIPYAVVAILGAGGLLSTTSGSDGSFNLEGVGFNPNLRIEVTKRTPPCILRIERPLAMDAPVVQVDIVGVPLKIPLVHCP